jgi:sarcosine oxidase subunit beta
VYSVRERTDAVIIGAGVIGAAIAFELGRRDVGVISVDKLPAAGYGPTSNSCAIVRAHYSSRDGVALAYEGIKYWSDWERYLEARDERGLTEYVRCGTLLLKTPGGHHEKALPHYRELGVPFEEWDCATLRQRMPIFSTKAYGPPRRPADPTFWAEPEAQLEGAVYTPESGYVSDPQLAAHNLQRAAEVKGARFRFREEVVAVRRDRGRVTGVTLRSGQEIDAPIVVNVAGPHSFLINRMAGVDRTMRIKTRALRHEVHHVPAPDGFDFRANGIHTSDGDTGIYFRPETGNNILVGSEDPACDPKVWVSDPDDYERTITEAQWQAQVYRLARRIPELGIPTERRGVVDLYDVSDDWIPIYDKSDLPGFYMAIGTSGNQFKNAPAVGNLMAELIVACEDGLDHDAEPLRVKARYTDAEFDLGFYSRNRVVNADSSFSVNG